VALGFNVLVGSRNYEKARKTFSYEELMNLTLAIITINGWNRLAITFRIVPGKYQPGRR
jgi:alkylhydroperoxidase family enzyme